MKQIKKISELIKELQKIESKYGDIPIGFKKTFYSTKIEDFRIELKVICPKTKPHLDINMYTERKV
jgi:hypothetical protein